MADIKDIVTEFSTIAGAMTGIGAFKYLNIFELESELRTVTFPALVLNKQRQMSYSDFSKHNNYRDYILMFGIYDDYNETEKTTVNYQTKQTELEDKAEKFMREFVRRMLIQDPVKWHLITGASEIKGELIERIASMNLIGIQITFQLRIFTDCDKGTFTY